MSSIEIIANRDFVWLTGYSYLIRQGKGCRHYRKLTLNAVNPSSFVEILPLPLCKRQLILFLRRLRWRILARRLLPLLHSLLLLCVALFHLLGLLLVALFDLLPSCFIGILLR